MSKESISKRTEQIARATEIVGLIDTIPTTLDPRAYKERVTDLAALASAIIAGMEGEDRQFPIISDIISRIEAKVAAAEEKAEKARQLSEIEGSQARGAGLIRNNEEDKKVEVKTAELIEELDREAAPLFNTLWLVEPAIGIEIQQSHRDLQLDIKVKEKSFNQQLEFYSKLQQADGRDTKPKEVYQKDNKGEPARDPQGHVILVREHYAFEELNAKQEILKHEQHKLHTAHNLGAYVQDKLEKAGIKKPAGEVVNLPDILLEQSLESLTLIQELGKKIIDHHVKSQKREVRRQNQTMLDLGDAFKDFFENVVAEAIDIMTKPELLDKKISEEKDSVSPTKSPSSIVPDRTVPQQKSQGEGLSI